jgi:hypothetical protein
MSTENKLEFTAKKNTARSASFMLRSFPIPYVLEKQEQTYANSIG